VVAGSKVPEASRSDGAAAFDAVGAAWTIEAEGAARHARRYLRRILGSGVDHGPEQRRCAVDVLSIGWSFRTVPWTRRLLHSVIL
jgi:hypothetical protein